jgi:hypothetical protein
VGDGVSKKTVAIVLGRAGIDSRVIVDGVDVSSMCTGLRVEAGIHGLTKVTLELSACVEITGEAGEVLKSMPLAEESAR